MYNIIGQHTIFFFFTRPSANTQLSWLQCQYLHYYTVQQSIKESHALTTVGSNYFQILKHFGSETRALTEIRQTADAVFVLRTKVRILFCSSIYIFHENMSWKI